MILHDLEAHFYPNCVWEAYCARSEYPRITNDGMIRYRPDFQVHADHKLLIDPDAYIQVRLDEMDKAGVTSQTLGISQGLEELAYDEAVELCRQTNDTVYELTKRCPGRFYGFASLPVQDPAAAADELKRCMEELGFLGWMTFSNYGATCLDHNRYRPILAAAEKLNAPVYLHPSISTIDRLSGLGHVLAGGGMGFTVDTMITLFRLILTGAFDQYPGLQMILGHLGEGLAFTMDRMDRMLTKQKTDFTVNKKTVSEYFQRNIWVTTSGVFSPKAYACAEAVLGVDRILFGSDYPYESLDESVRYVKENLPITQKDKEKICNGNAQRLFPQLR